jgi:ankyrin repeat protein
LKCCGVLKLLLENQAKVDIQTKQGRTALHRAIALGHHRATSLLLSSGADVNGLTHDHDMLSPLYISANRGHDRIIPLLLEKKADIGIVESNGYNPLHTAAEHGFHRVVKALFLCKDVNIDAKTSNNGATAFLLAVRDGHFKAENLLLKHGANMHAITKNGNNVWTLATSLATHKAERWLRKHSTESGRTIAKVLICHKEIIGDTTIISKEYATCAHEDCKRKEDLKNCALCEQVYYYSPTCQKEDWKKHKQVCNKPEKKEKEEVD